MTKKEVIEQVIEQWEKLEDEVKTKINISLDSIETPTEMPSLVLHYYKSRIKQAMSVILDKLTEEFIITSFTRESRENVLVLLKNRKCNLKNK